MDQTALDLGVAEAARADLAPVEIIIEAACLFEPKPCALCGKPKGSKVHTPKASATCAFKRQNGCAKCGQAKGDDVHFGAPPSLNVFSGRDPNTYRSMIESWKSVVLDRLRDKLPPGVVFAGVLVEGQATFPKAARRDQGNHRVLIEKAVGDALVEGEWLADDDWTRYNFGNLDAVVEPGTSRTRLMIFPR